DMGTSSLKCLVADLRGRPRALARREVSYFTPEGLAPLGREFSPDRLWRDACDLVRCSLREAGLEGGDITALSATSQREGMVLLDREGQELYTGPNQDVRAFFEGMAMDEKGGEDIYTLTGNLPSFLYALAKLKWFHTHRPDLFDRIHKVLPISSWLTFKLTGQARCERSALGEIGLLNVRTGDADDSLLKGVGMGPEISPALGDASDVAGEVEAAAAASTGLREGTPVVLGGPDTQCGLLGMGVIDEGHLGVLAGWSAPLQLVTATPIFDPKRRTWTGCHVVPRRWVLESSTSEGGQALQWLGGLLGAGYEGCLDSAVSPEEAPLGQDQTLAFLGPRIMDAGKMGLQQGGILFPVPVGPSGIAGRHLLQAALENLAFAINGNYLQLQEVSGLLVSEVVLGGGVTNISSFPRLVADTLGVPVRVPEMKDVSLLGAAMCAAVGTGAYESLPEAAAAMGGPSATVEPSEPSVSQLQERYQRWWALYQKLEDLTEEL
ncbi:MAG: FGGY-family carbohydrate kinase, partial [Dehalococcoidia bacterium]